jgi:dolichol kinase
MDDNKATDSTGTTGESRSLFWTAVLYAGSVFIIATILFVDITYLRQVVFSLIILNIVLVVLVCIGNISHERIKGKSRSATTFSRKMFNIIAGLLFGFLTWLFSPWMGLFILLGIDFTLGIHEVIYAGIKRKTFFTDAFNALGRQSEPYKPYLAAFSAVLAFTIVLGFLTVLFQSSAVPNHEFVIVIVYVATVLIWGVGDTAAYYVGTRYGKHRLPWNRCKSWEGFIANMASGFVLGLIFFAPVLLPFLTPAWWILLAVIGGFSGAFFESIDIRLDDNFVAVVCTGLILGLLIVII